ncbi:MAG: hypothetical protein JO232_07185 [Verrucomicrobia bacterium]|nr:hypothetical protein [Verrucomicrobiota bacterium]
MKNYADLARAGAIAKVQAAIDTLTVQGLRSDYEIFVRTKSAEGPMEEIA